jgi:outer membrane protein insertion porin family
MHILRVCRAAGVVGLCAAAGVLMAQARVLREITFTGAPAYSQAELVAFTGLKPGESATQQQVEDAAQRLNDTGLFDEVNFSGNDSGVVYALKPAAASAMLPVRYSNFVWWGDAEINQALKQKVALYRSDSVPIAGNLRDKVAAELTAMLAEKGVAGARVGSRLASSGGAVNQIIFAIDSPAVLIRSLKLAGMSPGMGPGLADVIRDIAGGQWDKDSSYINIASRVGDVYRNQGYLDIAVTKQEHSAPVITADNIGLDITATLSEGAQYHVSQLDWPGSEMLSAADFNKQAMLKVGDPASPMALRESLKVIADAYAIKGYLDAKVLAQPSVDLTAHKVAYSVSATPGPLYHFRSVSWPSVSAAQAKAFDAAWELKPGDVYDGSYPLKFLSANAMLRSQGYRMNVTLKRDTAALMVDLSITFTKAGASPQP